MRDKSSIALLICLMTLLSLTASVLLPQKADASSLLFTPPSQVTLTMYVLNNDGSIALGRPLCQVNDSRYGCTADSNKLYPFSSSNITIGIENHIYNSVQQGYLYNVTPHEVAIEVSSQNNKSLSTVKAQAIAARTFTYYNIFYSVPLNNSNDDQVYIPFTYDGLTSAQQQRVNQAVAEVIYMSTDGDTPISAHYGQDNDLWTSENENLSYLKSVYDPISAFYGTVSGTENGGMSSKGASRWGFGHTSSRGPVASSDPNYPGDNNGDGNFWSVRWDAAEQILAHYYTGVEFVGAPNLSNDYRFNVLDVEGLPEQLTLKPGESAPPRNAILQNTGPFTWAVIHASGDDCLQASHPTRLSYHLYTADNSSLACEANRGVDSACFAIERVGLCRSTGNIIEPGTTMAVPNVRIRIPSEVPPGTYNLRFDLEIVDTKWASGLPYANHWPTQDIEIIVEDPGGTGGEEPSANINHPPAVFSSQDWLNNGQRFGLSWVPVNGANYFDFRYHSREFLSSLDWDDVGWTAQLNNIPYTSVYDDNITCDKDRREYRFQVRGQIGPSGDEGSWRATYSNLRVFPFLSLNNVSYGYAVFFELDSPITTHSNNLYVTNAGGGTLQWQVTDDRSWIDLSSTSGTNDGTVVLTITKPGDLGIYSGMITFTTNGSNPVPAGSGPVACNRQQGVPAGTVTLPVTVFVLEQVEKMYFPIIFKNANP